MSVECQNKYRSVLLFQMSPPDGSQVQDQVTRSTRFSRQMAEQSVKGRGDLFELILWSVA